MNIPAKMKAMVLEESDNVKNHPLQLQEIITPNPKEGEILIKVGACGVCHTDLHEIEGEINPILPIIPGHEIIGTVVELGQNVENHKIGDRVGVAWIYSACGNCVFCKKNMENLCSNAIYTGFSANGGYAEYMIAPHEYAFPIPKVFSDIDAAPLMCAGIIGYRSLILSNIKPGGVLGLFGFGASAHIAIQIANHWGCEVYVFTRSPNHQTHAKELGAKWVGTSKDIPPKPLDAAVTFAPVGTVALDALKKLDKGGTLAINAIYLTDIPPISWDNLYHERKITSVANFTRKDAITFLKIAGEIPISTNVVPYSLTDANIALEDLKKSKINGSAVLTL